MDEAKQIEMVYQAINGALKAIELVYKPLGKSCCQPYKDIKDEKIMDYYYTMNEMCCELSDRKAMDWQKEDNED